MSQARRTCSMTSGFSGSPAPTHSRSVRTSALGQVGLHQHPPDRGRRAQRGHPAGRDRLEQHLGGEPLVAEDQRGGPGDPRREHVAPGVLGPAGRGDVQVHVAGLQADPVHRGQVPGRVGDVRVLDQLGLRGGAGGEVQQQRVGAPRRAVRGELRGSRAGLAIVGVPSAGRLVRAVRLGRFADRDAGPGAGEVAELRCVPGLGDHVPDLAAPDPVGQVQPGRAAWRPG